MKLNEVFHTYDNPDYNTKFHPVKSGDQFRFFHGFRDFHHAVEVAKYGLSGKEFADRVYSYEGDNNPYGLFVTLDFKKASDFVGAYGGQAVLEFVADLEELEAPVWPGGGYTVQGQMAQYFGHGRTGRLKRKERAKDAEAETEEQIAKDRHGDLDHIKASEKKYLAYMLTNSSEHQALYVGDLDPKRIAAIHVRKSYQDPWQRLSRTEFLNLYGELEFKTKKRDKVFAPHEDFDGEEFLRRMSKERGDHIPTTLGHLWNDILTTPSNQRTRQFLGYFENYLWPRQYKDAILWFKRYYGRKS